MIFAYSLVDFYELFPCKHILGFFHLIPSIELVGARLISLNDIHVSVLLPDVNLVSLLDIVIGLITAPCRDGIFLSFLDIRFGITPVPECRQDPKLLAGIKHHWARGIFSPNDNLEIIYNGKGPKVQIMEIHMIPVGLPAKDGSKQWFFIREIIGHLLSLASFFIRFVNFTFQDRENIHQFTPNLARLDREVLQHNVV